ncbi:toll/interleukin-1 receptor domain-containing protein [Acidicapsa dinghuensis]|uniref:Toll/interleukin-1 receptor domain-containing protein n=1 Tax=Acidicapsa dinghuensis TaxID=2218256 RepID=A0ABW1ED88_9BACT|nr:toll/interleukin-1 receptor domain-containing protein [Acidicapsa dinghuensis]
MALLRALAVLANPTDLYRYDADFLWQQMADVLEGLRKRGAAAYERLQPATAAKLRERLEAVERDVVHIVVHGQEMAAAHYATVALEASDGRAGKMSVQALAAVMTAKKAPALVVLQAAASGPTNLEIAAREMLAHGVKHVVVAPRLNEHAQGILLAKVYGAIAGGLTPIQLAMDLTAAASNSGAPGLGLVAVKSAEPQSAILPSRATDEKTQAPGVGQTATSRVLAEWREVLRRKRDANAFDVFLCHNSADKPAVRRIGEELKQRGILPWLDVEELPPGVPWMPLLEQQIHQIRAAAVCVGSAGIGPWQEQEIMGFLRAFVKRGVPVIPVVLADAMMTPELPVFLSSMTWVDFRRVDLDPMERLVWGITGKRPDA